MKSSQSWAQSKGVHLRLREQSIKVPLTRAIYAIP